MQLARQGDLMLPLQSCRRDTRYVECSPLKTIMICWCSPFEAQLTLDCGQYKRAFLKKTKDVKSYSSSDLSQILGYSVPPSQDDQSLIAKDSIAQYSKVADSKEGKEDKGKKSKKPRKSKKSGSSSGSESDGSDSEPKPVVMKGEAARRPALPLPPPSVLKGVLVNMFEHGGFLGSKIEVKEQDWVFDEATQEKIAVDAHASKVQSKQGLGFGNDKPSKLGKDFFGEKKKFDSDGEEDEADAGKRKSKVEAPHHTPPPYPSSCLAAPRFLCDKIGS